MVTQTTVKLSTKANLSGFKISMARLMPDYFILKDLRTHGVNAAGLKETSILVLNFIGHQLLRVAKSVTRPRLSSMLILHTLLASLSFSGQI